MGQENAIFTNYSIPKKAFQPILMCHQIASSRLSQEGLAKKWLIFSHFPLFRGRSPKNKWDRSGTVVFRYTLGKMFNQLISR